MELQHKNEGIISFRSFVHLRIKFSYIFSFARDAVDVKLPFLDFMVEK